MAETTTTANRVALVADGDGLLKMETRLDCPMGWIMMHDRYTNRYFASDGSNFVEGVARTVPEAIDRLNRFIEWNKSR